MPSHSRAKRVASGSVLISLVNWSYSLVTDGVKATPEINPLPVDKSVLIVTIQFRCIGKVREFRLFSYGYLILSIQQRSNTIPTTTSRHHWRRGMGSQSSFRQPGLAQAGEHVGVVFGPMPRYAPTNKCVERGRRDRNSFFERRLRCLQATQ